MPTFSKGKIIVHHIDLKNCKEIVNLLFHWTKRYRPLEPVDKIDVFRFFFFFFFFVTIEKNKVFRSMSKQLDVNSFRSSKF